MAPLPSCTARCKTSAVAIFHPAAALRNPQWQVEFERDMLRLPRLLERAQRANAAAVRGEARPAGVPHPGDPDDVAPSATITQGGGEQALPDESQRSLF